MVEVDTTIPVLVTGANGYVASWIVKHLLDKGVTVRATVRDPSNTKKVQHLLNLAQASPGKLLLFKADLLEDGSFAKAMNGVGIVFHTASPFKLGSENPMEDLIKPAENGTRNVLHQASKTRSVKRVILTSSTAAIGTTGDMSNADHILNEESWNNTSTEQDDPYPLSKTIAERTAWAIAEHAPWDLVVVNPGLILGRSLSASATSGSFDMIRALGNGAFRDGLPGPANLSVGLVDVRDVADAHVAAGYLTSASGRFIVFAESGTLLSIADMLRSRYSNYPLPTPNLIFDGIRWKGDNSRSKNVLGIEYRSLQAAVEDMFQQLIENGDIVQQE